MKTLTLYALCTATILSVSSSWGSSTYTPEGDSPAKFMAKMTSDMGESRPMKRQRSKGEVGEVLEYGDKRVDFRSISLRSKFWGYDKELHKNIPAVVELLLSCPNIHTLDVTTDKHYMKDELKYFLPLLRKDTFLYLIAISATADSRCLENLGEEMGRQHIPVDQQIKVYEKIIWIPEPGLQGDPVKHNIPSFYIEAHARYYKGEFGKRVYKLEKTLNEWEKKQPDLCHSFLETLGCTNLEAFKALSKEYQQEKIKKVITQPRPIPIQVGSQDVEELISQFMFDKDAKAFNPLEFYRNLEK